MPPSFATPVTDIVDALRDRARILPGDWRFFTGVARFHGPARPVALNGPDKALAELLGTPGRGAVAVVSVGAGDRVGVFGDGMARAAEANGWAGVVIDGAVCDVALIRPREIGVAARRAAPIFLREGLAGAPAPSVAIGGVVVRDGDWIAADEDGIVALDAETAARLRG
ncbi:MAG: RraA family protein [Rubrimonas sp.]|uniref:RraA family protein n=1 Tax=Rubrimonas sp. TaxID=2036015 RepID=UPI002FDE3D1A